MPFRDFSLQLHCRRIYSGAEQTVNFASHLTPVPFRCAKCDTGGGRGDISSIAILLVCTGWISLHKDLAPWPLNLLQLLRHRIKPQSTPSALLFFSGKGGWGRSDDNRVGSGWVELGGHLESVDC
ncbi:hypothetical protein CEXT_600651 [Caerostris extrusa]|uniref:Uncharacterized protein n=1 Tax=Caerostris extrusa TaxID=172846 RepID=A0AAV4X591_CAEEX|nr:hypothetical protein CEXT_600651 [Caerostris extrusa]